MARACGLLRHAEAIMGHERERESSYEFRAFSLSHDTTQSACARRRVCSVDNVGRSLAPRPHRRDRLTGQRALRNKVHVNKRRRRCCVRL